LKIKRRFMNMKRNQKMLSGLALILIVTVMVVSSAFGVSTGRWDASQTGCTCHSSTADPTVNASITGLPPEYTPDQTYSLTITVSGGPVSAKGGFNLEILGGVLSTFDSNVQINGPKNQATHTNPNQRSWTVEWTAPSKGFGDVNFWLAGNAVNGNGFQDTGDKWNLFSTTVPEMPPPENIITLKQGWNLISVPWLQEDSSRAKVLETIEGSYDAVQSYNSLDSPDPWKQYIDGKSFGNDLSQLSEKMGIWIHITQPGDTEFLYNGTPPSLNQTIPLYDGWNLVGYPSLEDKIRDSALNNINFGFHVDLVQTYNATSGLWEEVTQFDYLEKGRGYWIHSIGDHVWDVPL
jgi:hypothetical protein